MIPRLRTFSTWLLPLQWLWWMGVLVWGAVLFMLSADSAPPSGPTFPFKDKVLHCLYFSGGAFCLLLAFFGKEVPVGKAARFVIGGMLFAAITGALDEYHQTFTPGRSGNDPWDWLADVMGGLLGAWIALRFLRWVRQGDDGLERL